MPFGLQPIHLVVIVVVALLIFGPKRLPQIGRWIGRTFSEFRKGAREMAEGFQQENAAKDQAAAQTASAAQEPTATQAEASRSVPRGEASSPYPDTASGNYCTRCGASNALDARFCNKCGTRLPT
ncbi:MAG TPA: twin-arginine translocase TatA/TatE family subunit [Spirochaetia bacterium]|nr:twin-arginine translocase TatA/TatE family subunit [Spirochaetia bacterium]